MLSTGLIAFLTLAMCSLLAISCFITWRVAHAAKQYANDCFVYLKNQSPEAISLKAIADLTAQMTELSDAYEALLESHKKLRSRIGMRELREKRKDLQPDNEVDISNGTDKRALRLELRKQGLLK